jgi:hypothetical protein
MDDANDEDADTSTMSVDGQSDDRNHMSERSDGDRRQEYDRSNLSDASEHKHDDDEDIEDTRTRGASITIDLGYESDDGKRTLERGDPNGEQPLAMKTMMAMMLTMNGQGYTIVVTEFQNRGLPHAHIPPPQVEHDVNLEIINLTMDKPAVSSSSIKTPESKPKKRQRDPEVLAVDSL